MSDTDLAEDSPSEEEEMVLNEDVEEVTIWAPEPGPDSDDVVSLSVDEWIQSVDFNTTEDVPIPNRLVDQVIGQEAGSVVIKKAAEQRRHMLMIQLRTLCMAVLKTSSSSL